MAYIEDLRSTVPYVHPAARATIHSWLQDMHDAADQDDAATVARLARLVTKKIEQEIEWQRGNRDHTLTSATEAGGGPGSRSDFRANDRRFCLSGADAPTVY
jgi:hypothetical protein